MARILRSRSILAAVAAAVALVTAIGLTASRAEPRPDLPEIAPAELIASSLRAIQERTPLSGTITTHVDLGLPTLPSNLSSPEGPAGALLADQTFKVWRSPDGARVAQILPFAERDVVANATDVWYWDSIRSTAWHHAVPPGVAQEPLSLGDLQTIVDRVVRAARPFADLSAADPTVVAGRDAYLLRLSPTSQETLVGHIDVAIDARTRIPLRLQVFAKGAVDPSIEAGFTAVDFGAVDPSMFAFTPPEDATTKEAGPTAEHGGASAAGTPPEVRIFGEGFGLILAVQVDEVPQDLRAMFPFAGPLAAADVVDRGDHAWVVAGAVPSGALAEVEPRLP